jgi:hypothetical protein
MFDRVLNDGNWYNSLDYAKNTNSNKPYIVLVTGLNGIRKTTSMYQHWFKNVLKEALGNDDNIDINLLPIGENSFFRQLDYIIATIANDDFRHLYSQTSKLTVLQYSNLKNDIFTKYRTVAEVFGMLLLRCSKDNNMNALVETSGRDIAMFDYIDFLYNDNSFNKLALHFSINHIHHAERSVDMRMSYEMRAAGDIANKAKEVGARSIVKVNAGGPYYGSEVLAGVQADSDKVWSQVINRQDNWMKASIMINGSTDPADWSVQAILPDGTLSPNRYSFKK